MAKRGRNEADAVMEKLEARVMLPPHYEFDYNVTWKTCRHLGCLVRCVYACPGSESDGQWMCCKQCDVMFCEKHRDHAVHGDGINRESDDDEDNEEAE